MSSRAPGGPELWGRLAQLVDSPEHERNLIEGSHLHGADFGRWTESRSFIASFIHRRGSILDVGCANGLLLACLVAWSRHELVPYGVDVDEAVLRAARRLFPEWSSNFARASLGGLAELPRLGLPSTYDFVYWNVWDDVDFSQAWQLDYARDAIARVRAAGRLCLGFYDSDEREVMAKLARLASVLGPISGRVAAGGGGQFAAWWHRNDSAPGEHDAGSTERSR